MQDYFRNDFARAIYQARWLAAFPFTLVEGKSCVKAHAAPVGHSWGMQALFYKHNPNTGLWTHLSGLRRSAVAHIGGVSQGYHSSESWTCIGDIHESRRVALNVKLLNSLLEGSLLAESPPMKKLTLLPKIRGFPVTAQL